MANAEAKKLDLWAENGDREQPEDVGLDRAVGWPVAYEQIGSGSEPERTVWNQILRELSGLFLDFYRAGGIPAWDAEVDYRADALVGTSAGIRRATVATGPATGNATDPLASSQTVMAEVLAVDTEAKKIVPWAANGDRTDPDDAALEPALVRRNGWPSGFSADAGDTPRRRVVNQLLHELTVAAVELRSEGVLPWDADIDYVADGVAKRNGTIYRALVATGPATGNATDPASPGQVIWATISGEVGEPDAPAAPAAVAGSTRLDWRWRCPADNGAQVATFDFRWRVSGTAAWTTVADLTHPVYALTGLTNGQQIEAQVRATNSEGDSAWSDTGTGTAVAERPGRVVGVVATGGDRQATVGWEAAEDGGSAITAYRVQWRSSGQAFSNLRQQAAAGNATEATIPGLDNGTEYFFRVQAVNAVGDGDFSAARAATPVAPAPPPPPPEPEVAPVAPGAPTGESVGISGIVWEWDPVDANPAVTSYALQWRVRGAQWAAGNVISGLTASCHLLEGLTRGTAYEVRVRAVNSEGTGPWSATSAAVTVTVPADLAGFFRDGATIRSGEVSTDSNTRWSAGRVDGMVLYNSGASQASVRIGTQDFTVAAGRLRTNLPTVFNDRFYATARGVYYWAFQTTA